IAIAFALMLAGGCGGGSSDQSTMSPLDARDVNLIFVSSEDIAFQTAGDVDLTTGNLTAAGLNRSLLMAHFLRRRLLGNRNVSAVYSLAPMTHLQGGGSYPDLAAAETIQQFALENLITLTAKGVTSTANSYPINVSYPPGAVPSGVATPAIACPNCEGLDFADTGGDNENLVAGIISAKTPGFYVFSAPWETIRTLLIGINATENLALTMPGDYAGPNLIYVLAVAPSGRARLLSFDSKVSPSTTYPALPAPGAASTPCIAQAHFTIAVTGGSGGAVVPMSANSNETVYFVRHAEAHPVLTFEDGNYVCAGQWRALALPNALRGVIAPDEVYSIDPAQATPGGESADGNSTWSYVRPALTGQPYAIANHLPYGLAASFALVAMNSPQLGAQYFFTGGQFSNHSVLVAYEHDHIPPTVNALLASYFPMGGGPAPAPGWPDDDYDTIWTVTLDANSNLSINNSICEGIDSATLPATCPEF
ncbi:MAG TPA: hypothetical protein VMT64_10550, partial [Candidatus Binataceae bacterium]|nr:hypothetical protein [Candidatus Binataceae bacterium]